MEEFEEKEENHNFFDILHAPSVLGFTETAEIAKQVWNWICDEKRSDPCLFTLQIVEKERERR